MRKLVITSPYLNDDIAHSQTYISKKPAEDQISRVLSNQAIRQTTRSMMATFFARRDLSVGDAPVIELSDSSEPHPNQALIGPTILDLKYVSISETNIGSVQQVNPGFDVDQEIDQKLCAEERDRGEPNVGMKGQPNQIPYA